MNIRQQALETLLRINHEGAYSNLELKKVFAANDIKAEDGRLYLNIVYGCLQNQSYLDYLVKQQSSTPIKKLHKEVREILRIALYQIYFLDKIPDYAIVNEAVKMTVEVQPQAKGFVNGVLRSIMRKIEKEGKDFKFENWDNEKEALSIRYSLPLWIVYKYYETYGTHAAEAIIPLLNEKPPFTIRCNGLKTSMEELMAELEALGVEPIQGTLSPNAIHITNLSVFENSIEETPLYRDGHFVIQDQATLVTVERLDPKPGDRVLDMCAAPGGKTTYLSQLMENTGEIIARDIFPKRLQLIAEASNRLGCTNILLEEHDGSELLEKDKEAFDKILLDAPCSGLGVLRRKPEIRYHMTKEARKALVKIQRDLLENAISCLKPGGQLLYSTCTVNKDENENQIEAILTKHPEMKVVPDQNGNDYTFTSPLTDQSDGFFICLLTKE
ncbi:16S rRNA (cytosine(967)-C(5))-methyltransferase RsmB [Acetobacterium bakii]|uniref:16S rRNA (cytosine(967)-C(5))-methyltransferase n=1 Tax=Acetobacterium bakii TaxID=52689 RepID=A0A0L6TY53_9FIRM|nr:16S rRNA (cytosine(967)-C(5))-methyltransferase RsmB [Acetobacterium bakii]KNZ41178.1 16S rRNA methyltransferase [Acetobacterium bakii]